MPSKALRISIKKGEALYSSGSIEHWGGLSGYDSGTRIESGGTDGRYLSSRNNGERDS